MKLRIAGYTGAGSAVINILSEKLLEYVVVSSEGVGGEGLSGLLGGLVLVGMCAGRVVVKVRSLASMGRERLFPMQVFMSRESKKGEGRRQWEEEGGKEGEGRREREGGRGKEGGREKYKG